MQDESNVGLVLYSSGPKSASRRAFDRLREKCAMRAALAQISAEMDATLSGLNPNELDELARLISAESQAADRDVESMRAQVIEEQELARTQRRAMSIAIGRRASLILGREAEKRVQRGVFASSESLAGEAIERAFG
jgi:hypothetical protein